MISLQFVFISAFLIFAEFIFIFFFTVAKYKKNLFT